MLEIFKKIANIVFRRQTAIFLFFLFLSSIFWFMHYTGIKKELLVNYPVKYINKSSDIQITNNLPNSISVILGDTRTSFLHYFFKQKLDTLCINLADIDKFAENGTKTYLTDSIINSSVYNDFGKFAKIINFSPQIISINYITLASKIVPVVFTGLVKTKNQFIISDSISISPNRVKVYSSKNQIDTIKNITVSDLKIDSLYETTTVKYTLKGKKNIFFEPDIVQIIIPVEKSTEKTISVPINCINVPNEFIMRTFPSEVRLNFIISLSRFNKISEKDFTVEIDYLQRISNHCRVNLIVKPKNIKILSINPQEIEFALEQLK